MTVSPLIRPESPAAFDEFYRHYFVRVLALIRRHFPACDAEEIAQETMARCYVKYATLDPRRDPWHWVSSVARNAAIDSLRRSRKTVSTDELPEVSRGGDDTTYDAVAVSERNRSLRLALRRLRPADRQLIVDHEIEGLAYSEMAALRDMTPNAIRQKLHRARGRLATELRRAGATLGVVPVALHHRFDKAVRKLNDVSFAAGPAGASALSVIAVVGVATVATSLGGAGTAPVTVAAGAAGGGEVVAAVERGAGAPRAFAPAARAAARRTGGAGHVAAHRPTNPGTIPPVPTIVINRQGDPLKDPKGESGNDIRIPTPVGDVHLWTWSERTPGSSVLCATGVVGLSECSDPE